MVKRFIELSGDYNDWKQVYFKQKKYQYLMEDDDEEEDPNGNIKLTYLNEEGEFDLPTEVH